MKAGVEWIVSKYSVVTLHGTGTFLGTNAFCGCAFELSTLFFLL